MRGQGERFQAPPRLGTLRRLRALARCDSRVRARLFPHHCSRTGSSMTAATRYDAIVIGAGQAGGPLAGALARAGRRTALIERVHVGGTCINEGCTPTKTMVASARVAYL